MTHEAISRPVWQQTRQQVEQEPGVVLLVHDDTDMDYGYRPAISGLGPIGNGTHCGFFVHTVLALMPRGESERVLGLLHQAAWGFCCKNSQKNTLARRVPFLLGLGRYAKQAGDEGDLPGDVAFGHALHVPFPDHVHHLVALQGSPRGLERKETHPWLDAPFDEAVILLDESM